VLERRNTSVKSDKPSAASKAGSIFLGTSGWAYSTWKPDFYPPKTPSSKLLGYYATQLNSVEVNYTFRQLPTAKILGNWLSQVEGEFLFSFKAPQRVTHIERLREPGESLRRFFDSLSPVVDAGRMGIVLFQLPPNFKADSERLAGFLAVAVRLGPWRMAFEFRHRSWFTGEIYDVLRRHGAALCQAESDDFETPGGRVAPFTCYRFRKSNYSSRDLAAIQKRLLKSRESGDVFAYFKHEDDAQNALHSAELLKRIKTR
jgi:uncharacterized protein YecE (DUF72 family)